MTYDPVATLVRFNERYNSDGSGGAWSIAGREFIVEEIYRPLHSYNRVPLGFQPIDALCDECRLHVGTWVYDTFDAPLHPRIESCVGLIGVPIINTGADVPRQSGKTTTGLSIPYARLFMDTYERISYTASAEDQAIELVVQKLAQKIDAHPALKKLAHITADKIEVPRNHSQLEILPSSHGSSTGRSNTLNEYDECRDQKARVVTASMPAILAQHGYKCPAGHERRKAMPNGEPEVECCPVLVSKSKSNPKKCGARLIRWHARQLFLSASGLIEDDPSKDWFRDWIDLRIEKPDPFTHVYRTDKRINPSVSTEIHDGISRSFGDVEGMKGPLGVELNNAPARLGETYVSAGEYDATAPPELAPLSYSQSPSIAFLDSSRTGDKTSLVVIVESNPAGVMDSFARADLAHIAVWNPRDRESCPNGVVDDGLVRAELDRIAPLFPGLIRIGIDTRLMSWAKQLVKSLRSSPIWARRVVDTEGWTNTVNSVMYLELHQRVLSQSVRLWPCRQPREGRRCMRCLACELRSEMLAMRKRDLPHGGIEVYDAGGGSDGRNRRKGGIHRDIAMSLAGCCYLASLVKMDSMRNSSGTAATKANESKALRHIKPVFQGKNRER